MSQIDRNQLEEFMKTVGPETKVYFGCDSSRYKKGGAWWAEYSSVVVIHINGKNGCKVFAEVSHERDYDGNASKPFNRMFTEAQKVSELYNRFKDLFEDYEVAIHLDINSKKTAGSNVAMEAAKGYVRGLTQIDPQLKPEAWGSSYAADRAVEILEWQKAESTKTEPN